MNKLNGGLYKAWLYRTSFLAYKSIIESFYSLPKLTLIIEGISFSLEIIAVVIIFLAIVVALINIVCHLLKHETTQESINAFKRTVGKGIQVALELLIAADIINTVVLSATLENVTVHAILVLIRTFLSWTLMFETEGKWAWNRRSK
jgi:uncharacterized membrane protein